MAPKVHIEQATEQLLDSYIALSDTFYTDEPVNDREIVRWRHLDPKVGPSTAVELVDNDERVGRMWILIHEWSVRNKIIRAANPIDFLIREDHRGLPSFLSLFKGTMKEAHAQSDLVFHTSNPLTDGLYRKLMKYEPVTELDGAVIPVRPFAVAKASGVVNARIAGAIGDRLWVVFMRVLGMLAATFGVQLLHRVHADDEERVVSAHRTEQAVTGARSKAFREWRYKGASGIRYEQQWLVRKGRVLGYVVTTDRDVNGIKGRFVIDLVVPGGNRFAVAAMWLRLAAQSAAAGRHALFFFYNRGNKRLKSQAGLPLVTVPRSRLPQQVPIFVRPTDPQDARFGRVKWSEGYYVLSDLDLF